MTTSEKRFEETFVVGEAVQLTVSNLTGSITVQSSNSDESQPTRAVHITCVKRLDSCREPERTAIEIYQDGNHIVARTRFHDKKGWLGLGHSTQACAVDYVVHVPSDCDVEISQVSGTVRVGGVSGWLTVNAVTGAVELREIAGQTHVKAISATVDGDSWSGQANVDTISGAVKIGGARLSRVRANTVSGDLSFETTVQKDGRYDFHSVSGDVTLYLPSEEGVDSQGKTISGHLVCDLPHEYTRHTRSGWLATVNGGGPSVRFKSVSGDLEILANTA